MENLKDFSLQFTAVTLIFLMSGILFYPSLSTCNNREHSPTSYSFKHIVSHEETIKWAFADFDGDGFEEYARTNGKGVQVMDFIGTSLRTAGDLIGRLPVLRVQAMDLGGDGNPEIIIGIQRNYSIWTEAWGAFSSSGQTTYSRILRTEPISVHDRNGDGRWDGGIGGYQVLDVNSDEYPDIAAVFSTGYDMSPRGLMVFDGRTGKRIWSFSMAGHPFLPVCADVTGDGEMEIVIGDRAPCNGHSAGTMDDCHSYLLCLDRRGELVWQDEMGGVFTSTAYAVSELETGGKKKVICTYASGNQADESTHFELQLRSGRTGNIERYYSLPSDFGQPLIHDFDENGRKEIIVTNDDGFVYLFSSTLELLKKAQLSSGLQKCYLSEIVDINEDGKEEIMSTSSNNLFILDSDMVLIGKYQTDMTIQRGSVHYSKHPVYGSIISLLEGPSGHPGNGVILQVIPEAEVEVAGDEKTQPSPFFYLLLLAAGIAATITGIKVIPALIRRLRFTVSLSPGDLREKLLETLSVFGHGQAATANLDRLSFLFKNLTEEQASTIEYRKKINDSIQTYNDFTAPKLNEIIERARLAETEKEPVKNLERNLHRLEGMIELYSRECSVFVRIEDLKSEIPRVVEEIENTTKSITTELAGYYSCDIARAARDVKAALSSALNREGIQFEIFSSENTVAGRGFISKPDFNAVFEELINNAIFAMRESSEKKLTVRMDFSGSRITIEITDTGCGIKKEDHERIFDREYSTKRDGGFGLYHAKATLNKYGGKIKVMASEPGKGTTMRMDIKRI